MILSKNESNESIRFFSEQSFTTHDSLQYNDKESCAINAVNYFYSTFDSWSIQYNMSTIQYHFERKLAQPACFLVCSGCVRSGFSRRLLMRPGHQGKEVWIRSNSVYIRQQISARGSSWQLQPVVLHQLCQSQPWLKVTPLRVWPQLVSLSIWKKHIYSTQKQRMQSHRRNLALKKAKLHSMIMRCFNLDYPTLLFWS